MNAHRKRGETVDGLARVRAKAAPMALSKVEAAESLSISVDSFERYVLPDVRVVRRGRLVLVPVVELERWLDRQAALTLEAG